MKKSFLVVLSACILSVSVTSVFGGEPGFYVTANAGGAFFQELDMRSTIDPEITAKVPRDPGFVVGGGIGYDFSGALPTKTGGIRLEATVSYQKNDIDKMTLELGSLSDTRNISGDSSSTAFLANLYVYDNWPRSPFYIFLGGGIGAAMVSHTIGSQSGDDTVFAYQLGGGVGYMFNEKINLELKYQWLGAAEPKISFPDSDNPVKLETDEFEYNSHNITLGVMYKF